MAAKAAAVNSVMIDAAAAAAATTGGSRNVYITCLIRGLFSKQVEVSEADAWQQARYVVWYGWKAVAIAGIGAVAASAVQTM